MAQACLKGFEPSVTLAVCGFSTASMTNRYGGAYHLSRPVGANSPGGRRPPHDEAAVPFDWLFLELHFYPGGADRQIKTLRGRADDHLHTVLILHGDAGVTAG